MEKLFIITLTMTLGAFVSVDSLQCYQCIDCPTSDLKDSMLVSCPPEAATTTSAPVTATNTPVTSVPTITPATPEATNTPATPAATNTPATPEATNTPATPEATNTPATPEALPDALRVRRNIQTADLGVENKCTCIGVECACDEESAVPRILPYADVTYVCVKATVRLQNGTEGIVRGCAPSQLNNKDICTFETEAGAAQNLTVSGCTTCNTDKCNSAYAVENSVVVMLFVITSLFIAK